MNSKTLALDFAVKSANLCRHLINDKNERLISQKLFDMSASLSGYAYSMNNPLLSKNDLASLRKETSLLGAKISLLLDMLFDSAYISEAQKQSVSRTLSALITQLQKG